MKDRTRVVAYFDSDERAQVEQAAQAERMSLSSFVVSATLERARHRTTDKQPGPKGRFQALWELRGIGKETFAALGGGEAFLRRERAAFNEGMERREDEIARALAKRKQP